MARLDTVNGRWVNLEKPGGQVFFVGGGTVAARGIGASDTNRGLRPEEPLATIAQGHTLATAGRGDTIVLLPGSVTITAAIAITKADLTVTGYAVTGPHTRNPSLIVCATNSVEMISIDAANVTIENLTLDHNTTTANIDLIDIGDATASPNFVIRNVFFDMVGSATNTDAINISTDTVSDAGLIEGCTFHDYDQDAIVVGAANDEQVIRDNIFYDIANTGQYAISNDGDNCYVYGNYINTAGTAGIYNNGTLNMYANNRTFSTGANTIGILAAATTTMACLNNHHAAAAAGNLVDFTTTATSPSAVTDVGNVTNTNPALPALVTATVDGT